RKALPEADVPFGIPRYHLTSADLPEAKFLDTLATEETGPAARLRSGMSRDDQARFARWANKSRHSDPDAASLIAAINKTLSRRDVYDEDTFEGVTLADAVRGLLAQRDELE